MKITLYCYNKVRNIINKNIEVNNESSLEITNFKLLNDNDMDNPQFLINLDDNKITKYNYVKFEPYYDSLEASNIDYARYYYIDSYQYTKGTMYLITCTIDYLYTYANVINNQTLLIERYSGLLSLDDYVLGTRKNPTLYDSNLPKKDIITLKNAAVEQKLQFDFNSDYSNSGSILITTISNNLSHGLSPNGNTGGVSGYALLDSTYLREATYLIDSDDLLWIGKSIFENNTLNTYVKGLIKLPFVRDRENLESTPVSISLGNEVIKHNENDVKGVINKIQYGSYLVSVIDCTKATLNNDKNLYNSNCKWVISLPCYKTIQLDFTECVNSIIEVYYIVNYVTGQAVVKLLNTTEHKIIYQDVFQLGRQLAFNTSNQRQNENTSTSLALNTILSSVGSSIAVIGGVASGNPLAIAGGVLGGIKTITGSITGFNNIYSLGQTTTSDNGLYYFNNYENNQNTTCKLAYYRYDDSVVDFVRKNGILRNEILPITQDLRYFRIGTNQHLMSNDLNYALTSKQEESILNELEKGVYYDVESYDYIPYSLKHY